MEFFAATICVSTLVMPLHAPQRAAPPLMPLLAPLPRMCTGDACDVHGRPARMGARVKSEVEGPRSEEQAAVVKVYAVQSAPNLQMPWTAKSSEEASGSGFATSANAGRCVLTNAHVVADATYIEIRKARGASEVLVT